MAMLYICDKCGKQFTTPRYALTVYKYKPDGSYGGPFQGQLVEDEKQHFADVCQECAIYIKAMPFPKVPSPEVK